MGVNAMPLQRAIMRSFDFFVSLGKQTSFRWFETPWNSCDVTVMMTYLTIWSIFSSHLAAKSAAYIRYTYICQYSNRCMSQTILSWQKYRTPNHLARTKFNHLPWFGLGQVNKITRIWHFQIKCTVAPLLPGTLYKQTLTLILSWISNYMPSKVWYGITYISKLYRLHRWSLGINM